VTGVFVVSAIPLVTGRPISAKRAGLHRDYDVIVNDCRGKVKSRGKSIKAPVRSRGLAQEMK
jgi:hypothetical protein